MTQTEYLEQLSQALQGVAVSERDDIVREQRDHIEAALKDGRSIDDVLQSMGDPTQVAKSYRAQLKIAMAEGTAPTLQQGQRVIHAIFAVLVLTPMNLIFVLGPSIALLAVLLSGWAVGLSFFVGGLYSGVWGLLFSDLMWIWRGAWATASLGLCALGVAAALAMYLLTRFSLTVFLAYLKLNLRLIAGR